MADSDTYVIQIDRDWSLEDLYRFPRAYEQVYFLLYSFDEFLDERAVEEITHIYRIFPWRGGYSAVDFYNRLKYQIPRENRPQIASIQYSSPGWIELALIVGIAFQIERIVKSTTASVDRINALYGKIIKGMQQRKLMRLKLAREELRLRKDQAEFVEDCAHAMARALGFKDISEMNRRTGHPYITLKILLSLFRRIRTLVEYQMKEKADFSNKKGK